VIQESSINHEESKTMQFEVEDIDEVPSRPPNNVEFHQEDHRHEPDNLEHCGCSSLKFFWCFPLPREICCGFVSLRHAILAVTAFDMTTLVTSIVIFLYVMFYDKGAFKNKYYLYLTLLLRLCINILIGIVATVSLNVVCCNYYVCCYS